MVPFIRGWLWKTDAAFWFYRHFRYGTRRPDPGSFDFWIEGFPRSANTFTLHVMRLAFPGRRIVSHIHAPFLCLDALGTGKPGVLLVRDPLPAILSYCVMTGHHLATAIDYYDRFYSLVVPHASRLFIADFTLASTNPGLMIPAFCAFHGIAPPSLPADVARQAAIDLEKAVRNDDGDVNIKSVPRPEPRRAARVLQLRNRLNSSRSLTGRLGRCTGLYQEILAHAARPHEVAPSAYPRAVAA